MDDLARDFGFLPQGKSAPMRSDASGRGSASVQSSPFNDDRDGFLFNDAFGGTTKYTSTSTTSNKTSSVNDFDYDSIFKASASSNNVTSDSNNNKTSSFPVYDKPVYDDVYEDDIFQGLPGLKSKSVSSSMSNNKVEENIFASMVSPPKHNRSDKSDHFDDLLGNFGGNEKVVPEPKSSVRSSTSRGGFDDLLGGFGSGSSTSGNRSSPGPAKSNQTTSSVINDPFAGLEPTSTPASSYAGVFTDPLEEISKLGKFESRKADASPVSGGVFDDLDPLNGFGKPMPSFPSEKDGREKDQSPSRSGASISGMQTSSGREHGENLSFSHSQKKNPVDNFQQSPLFDMPSVSTDSNSFVGQNVSSPPPYESVGFNENNFQADMSPRSEDQPKFTDDIWLTVSEIPLFTQPTKAPPPSRPPPPIPRQTLKADTSFFSSDAREKGDVYPPSYSSHSETPKPGRAEGKPPPASQIDGFEDFAMGRTRNSVEENAGVHTSEDMDAAAAAMKDAMDKAEAKFRHAKEVKEREYAKARSKEAVQTEDAQEDASEREFRENRESLERERQQRELEEEEREQRRLERARQTEIERARARQAVERATREARERAAVGAREKAAAEARQRAEKVAVEKAQAEARERAGRVAVQRAQAEARERAAAEARERAEKAAAETKERATAEAREKEAKEKAEARRRAERASVDRANAEARERAAVEARERAAAAAARTNQQKNDNDLDSFFSSRPNSVPKPRPSPYDPFFDSQTQGKGRPEAANRTTFNSVPSPIIRKVSSTTNIVDDLSSIFGASPSPGEFQDVEGETEERRRARLERHQRTQERATKALAEKNQRDLQAQRDQEERHRHAEVLDSEIKRWAAGKEGNLRALLSTLQYVLWPECGWKPVSLTDLITGADVKKVYRRATLCIHPDKVQQKGATLQQKYIAEKVFDLLKEAWNKLNSEELF